MNLEYSTLKKGVSPVGIPTGGDIFQISMLFLFIKNIPKVPFLGDNSLKINK